MISTIELHPVGNVFGVSGAVTVVGGPPQWSDGSDATYGQTSDGSLFCQLEPLTLPAGALVLGIRAQIHAEADVLAQTYLQHSTTPGSGFVTYFTSDVDPTAIETTIPSSPATIDLIQSTHEVDYDPLAALEAGAWVAVDTLATGTVTVYELTVFVDYESATGDINDVRRRFY